MTVWDAGGMDDHGVTETNDPSVRIAWEREGRKVRIALDVDHQPEPEWSQDLPPMDAPPVDEYRLSTRPGVVSAGR